MKFRSLMVYITVFLTILSCNLPTTGSGTPTPLVSRSQGDTKGYSPVVQMPMILQAADLPFHIDCSAIDPTRQADCDTYLAITRDQVYPILRELMGVSLSTCYDKINYTIQPDNPESGAVGIAEQNRITYSQAASIDDVLPNDTHEIVHVVSFCSNGLDFHIFHGAFETHIRILMTGVVEPGKRDSAAYLVQQLLQDVESITEPGLLVEPCRGILGNTVTLIYLDLGLSAVQPLYQATINLDPYLEVNPKIFEQNGPQGSKLQALVNALKQYQPGYAPVVPECGYH